MPGKSYDEILRETALSTMRSLGMEPDPWQLDVLVSHDKRLLLNCCRQAGKSTTVALLSVLETVGVAGTQVMVSAASTVSFQAGMNRAAAPPPASIFKVFRLSMSLTIVDNVLLTTLDADRAKMAVRLYVLSTRFAGA